MYLPNLCDILRQSSVRSKEHQGRGWSAYKGSSGMSWWAASLAMAHWTSRSLLSPAFVAELRLPDAILLLLSRNI